jgi:hypothetical protein
VSDPGFETNAELVEAAFVHNEMEGEMIRGLLEGAGIPSILQAAGMFEATRHGFGGGVPVYGGAQKVMVHAHRLEEAQAVIAATLAADEPDAP